ncbi:MAG: carboxymuconolactone decarboxylase family protein [Oligoflexales bacterium]
MSRIQKLKIEEAPEKSQHLLKAVKQNLGKVPNVFGVMAHSSVALESYLQTSETLKGGQLSGKEREQIAMAVAGQNSCEYCVAAHGVLGKLSGLSQSEMSRNLAAESEDQAASAILKFVVEVMHEKGQVSTERISALRELGIDDGKIVEIVANVAFNIFTNYLNQVAKTEMDFPAFPRKS